jgi:hypothetical protein
MYGGNRNPVFWKMIGYPAAQSSGDRVRLPGFLGGLLGSLGRLLLPKSGFQGLDS